MKSRIKGSSIHNPESSNKRIYLFVHSPFFPIFAPESLKQAYNMNIKLHTPNSLNASALPTSKPSTLWAMSSLPRMWQNSIRFAVFTKRQYATHYLTLSTEKSLFPLWREFLILTSFPMPLSVAILCLTCSIYSPNANR